MEKLKPMDTRLSRWGKALAHPARIAIPRTLSQRDACVCAEIVDHLPLAQGTVSQHLKDLKNAGIITWTVEEPSSCYSLDKKTRSQLAGEMGRLFEEITSGCNSTTCSTKVKSK